MADLGRAALVVSFGLSLYALVAGVAGALSRQRRLADSARYALITAFGSTLIASFVLARALVTHDFRYRYVYQHTSRDLKPIYCLTAFWGGEEGSLLLWLLVLTGYGALAVHAQPEAAPRHRRLGGAGARRPRTFFSFILVAVASPFALQPRVVDGLGLVPSLQNIYMVIHPPMLYLGYVGMSIPFAFAVGRDDLRPDRRALDHRDAPLDAHRLDVPRLRPPARLALGLHRGRLGRLLRLGSGRERRADALDRRHRLPALGDDPGAQGDASDLEHGADRARPSS